VTVKGLLKRGRQKRKNCHLGWQGKLAVVQGATCPTEPPLIVIVRALRTGRKGGKKLLRGHKEKEKTRKERFNSKREPTRSNGWEGRDRGRIAWDAQKNQSLEKRGKKGVQDVSVDPQRKHCQQEVLTTDYWHCKAPAENNRSERKKFRETEEEILTNEANLSSRKRFRSRRVAGRRRFEYAWLPCGMETERGT